MVFGWFPWFYKLVSWFFYGFWLVSMVFLSSFMFFFTVLGWFPQIFFGQSSLLRNITRFLHVWAQVQLFYMQSPLRPNLYFQEIERHDPDLICLEEVNFGISRSNTSIQCPYSRWTASHSSGTIWTVWVLPGFGFQNLRRHV